MWCLVQAWAALVQSILQLIASGQDLWCAHTKHAEFIRLIQQDKSVEDAVVAVLALPKPTPEASNPGSSRF